MARFIEIVQKGVTIASYNYETKEFAYDKNVFKQKGDFLFVTMGLESKTFDKIPNIFYRYMPTKGSPNFYKYVKIVNANENDEFDLITKLGIYIWAPFEFKGCIK